MGVFNPVVVLLCCLSQPGAIFDLLFLNLKEQATLELKRSMHRTILKAARPSDRMVSLHSYLWVINGVLLCYEIICNLILFLFRGK